MWIFGLIMMSVFNVSVVMWSGVSVLWCATLSVSSGVTGILFLFLWLTDDCWG